MELSTSHLRKNHRISHSCSSDVTSVVSYGNNNYDRTISIWQGGPSGCPNPGQCTCNPASGVMTDHAMAPPFNRINNGCTEPGQVP